MKKTKLVIEFDSEESAFHFGSWLCGAGEQDYWNWMRYREDEEDGDITVVDFDYWDKSKNKKFLEDWTIRTKLGRTDED